MSWVDGRWKEKDRQLSLVEFAVELADRDDQSE